MTTYYVGSGGNDANAGTSWALRKLTLNGAEDIPVAANDTVYVGPGTYRELLTVDVSGTAGNLINYIGDYLGRNTDGVGGMVRITGSDNDQTATRANCVTATGKNYRNFNGFVMDTCTSTNPSISCGTNPASWTVQNCAFINQGGITFSGTGTGNTVQNCVFWGHNSFQVQFTHSATVSNAGHIVQNCLFVASTSRGVNSTRIGGITVANCTFFGGMNSGAIRVDTALAGGQTITVNNCIFTNLSVALQATVAGEITENYNTFWNNATDRTNTNTGANSQVYPPLFDPRWAMQLIFAGAGPNSFLQEISPFDLASYSALVNLAGTSPTTTDLRGTAIQGAQREWGILEYDSTLKIFGGVKKSRVFSGGF